MSLRTEQLVLIRAQVALGLGYLDGGKDPAPMVRSALTSAWDTLTDEIGDGKYAPVL